MSSSRRLFPEQRDDEDDEEEEEEHEDGYYRCGDLYWLYSMLAMLLELESSIEESAFIVSGGANIVGEEGERERRRWRRECEYLEEDVRESIGLEAAPHRILMRRERERARSLLSSESNSSDDDDEEEDERARRSRRQHYPIHGNTNSFSSRSGLHPVSFRVERRESVPLRVVPPRWRRRRWLTPKQKQKICFRIESLPPLKALEDDRR